MGTSDGERPANPPFKTLVHRAGPQKAGPRSRGVLTTAGGRETGRVFALRSHEVVTLGRNEECTFRFDDASVSGIHARVALLGNDYMFSDNSSTNGSYVNDVRVTSPVALKDADRVRLGPNCLLRFNLVDEDEEKALTKVYEAALYDGLTGIFNRKHLEERLDTELAFAIRHGTELSVLMIDIDHFKKVNDTYGHLGGDAVLKAAAQTLQKSLRAEDLLTRYGGEEFCVVARGITNQSASILAERLRSNLEKSSIAFEVHELKVTASIGIASLSACDQQTKQALVALADERLYKAKGAGRNRVVCGE